MLAGLVALPGVVVAAVTRKPDAIVMEITGATTIESLPFKQPDPALFELLDHIDRGGPKLWDGDIVAMDTGSKDGTSIAVWQANKGKFVCTHEWYLPPGHDLRTFARTSDGKGLQEALDKLERNEIEGAWPYLRFPPKRAS